MRRRTALCGIAALSLTAAPRAVRAQVQTIRIGIIPSEFAAQPWYADQLGLFAKAGLTPSIEPVVSGAAGAAAVASGALDVVYSNVLSLAIAHNHGIPLLALADANIYSPQAWGSGVLAVPRASAFESAKSFAGATIAVNGLRNVLELGARAWIDGNGGDSNTAKFVEIPDSAMEAALLGNRVDAAVMSLGVYPQLGKPDYPIRIVSRALASIAPTFDVSVWVTSRDYVAAHPVEARAFVAIMRDSAIWANDHHHETAEILATHTKRPLAAIEASVRYVYGTHLVPEGLQPQIDAAAKYGWLQRFPAAELIAALPAAR